MTSPVLVRPLQPGDFTAWRDAVGQVAREGRYLSLQDVPSLDESRAFAANLRQRGFPQFAALTDDRLIGWCDIVGASDRRVFAHRGKLGIGILDGWRGRGIGRRLITATIEAGWRFGFRRIELEARADNLRAIRLYESVGFHHEGLRRRAMLVDGIWHDEVLMALLRPEDGAAEG